MRLSLLSLSLMPRRISTPRLGQPDGEDKGLWQPSANDVRDRGVQHDKDQGKYNVDVDVEWRSCFQSYRFTFGIDEKKYETYRGYEITAKAKGDHYPFDIHTTLEAFHDLELSHDDQEAVAYNLLSDFLRPIFFAYAWVAPDVQSHKEHFDLERGATIL